MGAAISFLAMPIVLGVVVFLASQTRQKKQAAWKQVGMDYDLLFYDGGWFGKDTLNGTVQGQDVFVDTFTTSSGKSQQTWTRIQSRDSVPAGVKIGREGVFSGLGKLFKGEDLQIGDTAFDDAILIRGPERMLRAQLDADNRNRLSTALMDHSLEVVDGVVRWQKMGTVTEPHRLSAAIDEVVDVARALDVRGLDVTQALLDNLRDDPAAGVRRQCLLQLMEDRDPEVVKQALRIAESDGSPQVRLVAKMQAIKNAPAVGWAEVHMFASAKEPDHAVFAAQLVRKHTLHAGHDAMVDLLGRDDADVRVAAAKALAVIGRREAVEHLLPLTKGLLADEQVKSATRFAVESIQGRLGRSGAGGLAVVDDGPQQGRLSVMGGDGQLSEVEDPPKPPPKQRA
jgi:hypothetical protein